MLRTPLLVATVALLLAQSHPTSAQSPAGTAFSYQARLMDGNSPASGAYDLQWKLYDAAGSGSPPTGGSQIGSTACSDNVAVVDGLLTVELDFGAAAFAGEARWLEIGVRADSLPGNCATGTYSVLAPRQPINPTPYALYSLHAPWSGLTGVPPGFADDIDNVGGLVLPYAATVSDPNTLFSITNSGAGRAIDAASAGGIAMRATSPGVALLGIGTVIGSTGSGADDAAGVRGEATAASGLTYGVRGESTSSTLNASGVRGIASAATGATNGVWGTTASGTDLAAGVNGNATSATGVTYGVLGQIVSGTTAAAAVRANALNVAPAGPTYGLAAYNFGALDVVRGAVCVATSAAAVRTYGVQGQTNSGGAFASGVYGLANTPTPVQTYGVRGQNVSTLAAAAGVIGIGNGVAAPGVPNAAALEIREGAIRVSGVVRPAGTICPPAVIWTRIESCVEGICGVDTEEPHNHTIGWFTDIALVNPLIIPAACPADMTGSMIYATVETAVPPPPWTSYYVQVHSKIAGAATIRVSRMGVLGTPPCVCAPPAEAFWVHYQIINPAPAGALTLQPGGADADPVPDESTTR